MQPANLKRFFSRILPPAVRDVLSHLSHHGTMRFFRITFTGVFRTFDEVGKNFRRCVPYNSADSEREEIARAAHIREAVRDARLGLAPLPREQYLLLGAFTAALPSESPTILDIGGGVGDALPHLIYSCPGKRVKLIVQELPPIAAAGRDAFRGDESITFVHDLSSLTESVDLVFMGSSLQYFEEYQLLLKHIAAKRPRMVLIARTSITDAPTFVTAQVNMRRRIIPNKIINRGELTDCMENLGFYLIHRSESLTIAHFRNFPMPQRRSSFANMVFKAKL